MSRERHTPYLINSISELHRLLELPKPEQPLISVIDFSEIKCFSEESLRSVAYNFYCIALKKNFSGKMRYGQNYYDFDEGVMTFFSPGQVVTTEITEGLKLSGWWLVIHPDFIQGHSLATKIKQYGYFSYAVSEALHLSEKEETMVETTMKNIQQEYQSITDHYSQDVILSHVELLLNYCNRFYNRQFITRKQANHTLLTRMETLTSACFNDDQLQQNGLPTVKYIAEQLNVSPNYLSDMLRSLTGQSAQQHIHNKLIEKAKEMLSTTSLSVSEVAYHLGFEHPQSFNKLFKNKTQLSPTAYKESLN